MITLADREFHRLVSFVRDKYGINLEAKRTLIEARLAFHITQCGYVSFSSYIDYILSHPDGEECQCMLNRLSTNYSYFFRETDYIPHVTGKVLPDFRDMGGGELRIWSAACASGQEAYSVAMVLKRAITLSGYPICFHIDGTDINTEVLETASRGVYRKTEFESIPHQYRQFIRWTSGESFEVIPDVREKISWKRHNLMDMTGILTQYDLVFCRNVLIYFEPQTRKELIKALYVAIKPGGYLYTGITEAVDLERRYFKYVSPSIYRKE